MMKLYELLNHAVIACEICDIAIVRKDGTPGILSVYNELGGEECRIIDWCPEATIYDDEWVDTNTLYNIHYNEVSPELKELGLDPCDEGWCVAKESIKNLSKRLKAFIKTRNVLATNVEE